MLCKLVGKIPCCRIRFPFEKDVLDSGQEHPADSNNCFSVSAACLDSAVAFSAFRMCIGSNDGIGNLHKQRFQETASP